MTMTSCRFRQLNSDKSHQLVNILKETESERQIDKLREWTVSSKGKSMGQRESKRKWEKTTFREGERAGVREREGKGREQEKGIVGGRREREREPKQDCAKCRGFFEETEIITSLSSLYLFTWDGAQLLIDRIHAFDHFDTSSYKLPLRASLSGILRYSKGLMMISLKLLSPK